MDDELEVELRLLINWNSWKTSHPVPAAGINNTIGLALSKRVSLPTTSTQNIHMQQ